MKQIIYNAITQTVSEIEIDDSAIQLPIEQPPTMEERMAVIEQDNSTILDLLAGELGVTL